MCSKIKMKYHKTTAIGRRRLRLLVQGTEHGAESL